MRKIHVSRKLLSKYKTIEQAVFDANDGDLIEVDAGIYREKIVISKSVKLIGVSSEPENVIITGSVTIIENASVTVKNLTFTKSDLGLVVDKGHVEVIHCQFNQIKKYAIDVKEHGHLSLTDATIRHNGIGLYVTGRARAEYCAFYGQLGTQVYVGGKGRLIMKHAHIYQGKSTAFNFDHNSKNLLENCQIYGHHSENMQIKAQGLSEATLQDCLVYESQSGAAQSLDNAKITFQACKITENYPVQLSSEGGQLILRNSHLEAGASAITVRNSGNAQIENSMLTSHTNHHVSVESGSIYVYRSTIKFGEKSGITLTNSAYAHIESSDIFGHHLPQVSASERARLSIKHSSVFYGKHYGLWLTENASANIAHCRFYENEFNQIVIADRSEAELDDVQVFEGAQSGLYIKDNSHAMVVNSVFYHHNDLYPQVYVSNESTLSMRESRLFDSYESGIRFEHQSSGLIEHCQLTGHYEAQIDVRRSTPTIRECLIENGGTCAIRLLHAGGFIENCSFVGHEHNIAIGGTCETEIIGQEADALRQYAEALSQTQELEAELSNEEIQRAMNKAQEEADREARTAEIVGLVEQLEERLGKK